MRVKIRHSEPGVKYTEPAAQAQTGRTVPVNVEGRTPGEGTVTAARVIEDGAALELTVEVTGPAADLLKAMLAPRLNPYSIGTGTAPRRPDPGR